MSYLSIRNMNFTLARREQEGLSPVFPETRERSHYWFIERKSKIDKSKWVFVRDAIATKSEIVQIWNRHYRNSSLGKYRLVHKLKY